MAIVYRCDCCYSETLKRDNMRDIAIPYMGKSNQFTEETDRYRRDLCNNCWVGIIALIEPKPRLSR